ncbi:PREDICTED: uncharacterized protein LOC105559065 isoform X2 [Vollenhovia emeryi]|nr:PREDICTED: uncharacterized protein LOC105559065 isoform X2 [Vollenhovia emeryi]XP_011862491.1 PREDICTED: uncharacterized protein LOC105559065 isoform X2 [Vollenhovia emeryi]XP_011862492.1 PREDICTED: uncharacterized protein LOC105559065 isoform X2 [Vollenhovia emeryi]
MTEVEEWMWKHYTKENPDTVKCNRCEEIFSNHARLQILKYHLYDEHEITELDEHPERDKIQQNYKITCLTATCNHCKRESNLAINGVHNLIMHLKIIHLDKLKKKKRSFIWDKFDENDDKVICKQCKKTLKIKNKRNPITRLNRHHLLYCRKQKVSVLDKFDVKENKAICKVCEKIISINSKCPRVKLKQHLFYCRNEKKLPRPSQIWEKYEDNGDHGTCKQCGKTIKINSNNRTVNLHQHLRYCRPLNHGSQSEIERKKSQRTSEVWDEFDVKDDKATCKQCKRTIKINFNYSTSNLREHLYDSCVYRDLNLDHLRKVQLNKEQHRSEIWDKFDTDGGSATCKQCNKTMKITPKNRISRLQNHLRFFCHNDINE